MERRPLRQDRARRPQSPGDCREADPPPEKRSGPGRDRRRLPTHRECSRERHQYAPHAGRRQEDLPPGLSLLAGADPDARRRLERPPARADGAQGAHAAPRRPPRHARGHRSRPRRRPVRRPHSRRHRHRHRCRHPLRECREALPLEAPADARGPARHVARADQPAAAEGSAPKGLSDR